MVNNPRRKSSRVDICILALLAALVFSSKVFSADTRVVVDSAGRRVTVPAKIERIFVGRRAGGRLSVHARAREAAELELCR